MAVIGFDVYAIPNNPLLNQSAVVSGGSFLNEMLSISKTEG
jgi:hypothetical protein